jgi:hypothetical protein
LQFGHGMIDHSAILLRAWGGGGVILSPRDLKPSQLGRVAKEARSAGAEPLLDPQCYVHDADHARLTQHDYWKAYRASSTANLLSGLGARQVIATLRALNNALELPRHILPGLLARPVNDDWFAIHERFIEAAHQEFGGAPLIATVAVSDEAIRDEKQVEAIIDRAAGWPVSGFYVVGEVSRAYLVEDPNWLANLLILASGLKLLRKNVIVGYSSHQMLCLAACNIDAIASGTWLNVRSFPTAKFYEPEEDEVSRRTTWYYCPQVLSEYKLPFLDIARRQGFLDSMRPDPALGSGYADPLFGGAQPSSVAWGEQSAFRHYLTCLRGQCQSVTSGSFDEALGTQASLLDSAETGLRALRSAGVYGNDRDFFQVLDCNRSALSILDRARGARLRREW